MITMLLSGVIRFLDLIDLVIVVYCVFSWFMPRNTTIMQILTRIVDPILTPIRSMLWRIGALRSIGLDLAPFVAILLMSVLKRVIYMLMWVL